MDQSLDQILGGVLLLLLLAVGACVSSAHCCSGTEIEGNCCGHFNRS
jgi:hypothetical protein